MITENLSTLKIHKLTQAQYNRELEAGNIDENALYLTPDTSPDWNGNAWFAGTVEATAIILKSPNGTRFKITVGDDGILTSTEFTEEEKPFRPGDAYKSIV